LKAVQFVFCVFVLQAVQLKIYNWKKSIKKVKITLFE
jgi:hypothetical protein